MIRGPFAVVAMTLGVFTLAGCQEQSLGPTVGRQPCLINLHVSPRSVDPGGQVTLHRAPGCDKGDAHQTTVRLASKNNVQGVIGTATLGSDGAVVGTVVIPAETHTGRHSLHLDEKTGCSDTSSCTGHPTCVAVRVR